MNAIEDLTDLLEEVKRTRSRLLDLLDSAYCATPQWKLVRSRIMECFGRDGLEGHITDLIARSSNGAKNGSCATSRL